MTKDNYLTLKNIQLKTERFMKALKNLYHLPEMDFNPDASALLVIDMQKYFLSENSHAFLPASRAIIPQIKKLIRYFIKKKDQ
uniref:Isochorismatase family protein n=1 Tax=candidate division WOR-3 bacterium TaxID=2052148 RepID=A0A7C4TIS6_UNCW3